MMADLELISGYRYGNAELACAHGHLIPGLLRIFSELGIAEGRLFDLGCGNGSLANFLTGRGFDVSGIDASDEGVSAANRAFPTLNISQASAYEDLRARFRQFPVVLSLEVVEHLYSPRLFAKTLFDLVEPGGHAIVSTPYHGYLKNLILALTGRLDAHFTALWDHGHIKFWSRKTLTILLEEAGFKDVRYLRVGRVPALAKSMIAVARKP